MLLIGGEAVLTGAIADRGDHVGLGRDRPALARLGLVDRGGHDHAGAVTLDRAGGGELEGLPAGVFEQGAEHLVAGFEILGGEIGLASALGKLGLGGRGLGAGFV